MTDIYCFGGRPQENISRRLASAGLRLVHSPYTEGILESLPQCGAIMLYWKSEADLQVIRAAKSIQMPILVITTHLADTLKIGEPYADLYLEAPATVQEIVDFLLDMVPEEKLTPASVHALRASI